MISSNELFGHEKSVAEYIMEELENREKRIEEIHNMSFNERKFTIFKLFYNGLNESSKQLLTEATKKHPFILEGIYSLIEEANQALFHIKLSLYNREEIGINTMEHYKELLKKISKLSQELNIGNSLELSILFSYLLWNGYLSKDKTYKFQSSNRANLSGMLFTDILDGIGVCINNSEMLKDILNECGYNSCILVNHLDNFMTVHNTYKIQRNGISERRNILKEIITIRKANHAFNLIEDNNKLYVYDSTNLLLYNITNCNYAKLVNGKGKNIIFPYKSYFFCLNKNEVDLLDKLLTGAFTPQIYTKEDYTCIGTVNLDIIKNSSQLLEDFYSDIIGNIVNISNEINKKVKQRHRTR